MESTKVQVQEVRQQHSSLRETISHRKNGGRGSNGKDK